MKFKLNNMDNVLMAYTWLLIKNLTAYYYNNMYNIHYHHSNKSHRSKLIPFYNHNS